MSIDLPLRRTACLAAASLALLLSACGGGGGGGNSSAPSATSATAVTTSLFTPSASLANQCVPDTEKQWERSYVDEAYLWYDQVQAVQASEYATPESYYSALLVRTPDASGLARDRFSTVMTVAAADAMQGITSSSTASATPSMAASATNPVPITKTVTSPNGRKVGYILFNQHSQGAQDALITAFRTLQAAAVQDLVLDLRYNAGGFIYVAQAAAAMVAGPSAAGQVFERARYSDKRAADSADGTFFIPGQVDTAETQYPKGTPLPQLNLPRLYVLTSTYTCSASESIINSLRGIGVQVILVGNRTCGKPYGFHRKDNCGKSYFPIEFQLTNAAGFGDYTTGFPVQCQVQENPTTALGSTSEPLLAGALRHIDTGSCPVSASTAVQSQSAALSLFDRPGAPDPASAMYQPGWDGRRLAQ